MIHGIFKRVSVILVIVMLCSVAGLKAQTIEEAITATNNEQYDKADQILQNLSKTAPTGKVYYRLGENTLLNFFSDTISNSPKVVAAEARAAFEKGIAITPNDPLNYVGLAKISAYMGEKDKATELRAKAKSFLLPYKKVSKIPNPQEYAYTLAKIAESYIIFNEVDTTLALPNIREALTIDEKNAEIYIIAGDIYLLKNNGSLAIKMYNKAQDADLKSPMANMKIGSIYFKSKNFGAAIPYYEQAIALDKNYAPAYRELGQLYQMAARLADSKANYEIYLKLTNQNIPAKIRYVNALFYSKNYAEVIKNVEDIFKVDQSRNYLNRIAGYSCYEQGDYVKALAYMDKLLLTLQADLILKKDYIYYARILVKKNQGHVKVLTDLDNAQAELAKIREKNESLKGPAKEKEKVSEAPMAAKVNELQKTVDAANAELNKAFEMYEKAISFERANATVDEDANLIMEKGNVYFSVRRYTEAADTWKRLITKGKDSEEFYLKIGKAYYMGKDFDKADAFFDQMLLKYPDYLQGYLFAAQNSSAKDPDSKLGMAKPKFTALLSKAALDSIKNENEMYEALKYLGYNAMQSGNSEQAKAYYNRMANLDPNNKDAVVKAYSSMATLYMSIGEYSRATEFYNKILALEPGNAQAKSSIQYIQALQSSAKPKAHPNEISGVIKDSSGQPIAGVDIRVKDTAAEAWTNAKGEYRFTMPEASTALIISAKGFKTVEIPVTTKRVYNATLKNE